MSIDIYLVGNFSENMIRLIKAHKIVPKPVGVKINFYKFAKGRIFSYGFDNAIFTGYGGYWFSDENEPSFGLVNVYNEYEEENLAGFDEGVWRQ